MAPRRPSAPQGDPHRVEALLAAEARLGVIFPDSYRAFVAEPKRHRVGVKRARLWPVERCEWLDDEQTAVAIGQSWADSALGLAPLVFKLRPGRKSRTDAVYTHDGSRFKRAANFSQMVDRERTNPSLSDDPRVRLAQRLSGIARSCTRCSQEIRALRECSCGRIGETDDPSYQMNEAQRAEAAERYPTVFVSWAVLKDLRDAKATPPRGPKNVIRLADLLEAHPDDAAIVASRLVQMWNDASHKHRTAPALLEQTIRRHLEGTA